MSNVKLQPTRILQVISSDYCDIPYPTVAVSDQTGHSSAVGTNIINSPDNIFRKTTAQGNVVNIVNPGDVIYFEGADLAATVVEVLSASQIRINADILTNSSSYTFTVYQNSLFPNQGCQLLILGDYTNSYNIRVTSSGQDYDIPNGDPQGYVLAKVQPQLLPLQIVKLWNSDTSAPVGSIFAVW